MSREGAARVSLSPAASRRKSRTLEERLALHWPALYHRLAALAMRLPRRSRVRRALLRRQVHQAYAAYNRRDDAAALLPYDEEVEAHQAEAGGVPIGADLERSWRGHAGFRRMWDQWDEAWTDTRLEPSALFDLGDRVLVLHTFVGRGRSSGAEVRHRAGILLTVRGGRAVRWEQWWDWDEALAAAGAGK